MPVVNAGPAEIIRASQKDESYLDHIKSSVVEIFQRVLGNRFTLKSLNVINAACEVAYFYLTTIGLRQTLGEEYTGIVQTDGSKKKLPSLLSMIFMVVSYCLGQLLFTTSHKAVALSLNNGYLSELQNNKKDIISKILAASKSFPSSILKLHLISFYLQGTFYHLSKRLMGVKYVTTKPENSRFGVRTFRILGFVLTFHYVLQIIISVSTRKNQLEKSKSLKSSLSYGIVCPLCLEKRKNSSATPCGHLFCWQCIHDALSVKDACPICRKQTLAEEVIPLLNFS